MKYSLVPILDMANHRARGMPERERQELMVMSLTLTLTLTPTLIGGNS